MSRAEYLRAYRAARRAEREQRIHLCEGCGQPFTPQRSDARFCSNACRAATWRPITHHAAQHRPDGIPFEPNEYGYPGLRTCMHEDASRKRCQQAATWQHDSLRNQERHLISHAFYCDEHINLPAGVVPGEPLQDVVARAAREARRRHGTRATSGSDPGPARF
jgi:hypothetical protein